MNSEELARYSHYFQTKKDLTYWRVYTSALELETLKPSLKWSLTELAQKSDINRALVYHYFGKSKKDIIKASVLGIGNVLFGLDPKLPNLWEQGLKQESLQYAIDILQRYPFLKKFYVKERNPNSPYHDEIKSLEDRFIEKMKSLNTSALGEEVEASIAALIGLLFFSDDEKTIGEGMKLLKL